MSYDGYIDIVKSVKRYSLAHILAYQDIRSRYRRSTLGPFWITLSMLVMISCIGVIFGSVYNIPREEFFLYLAIGFIFWNFFSGTVNEGCFGFIEASLIIKQHPVPFFVYTLRIIIRNTYILGHNLLILPFFFLLFKKSLSLKILIIIPNLILIFFFLGWVVLILSLICARYRDLPNLISSIMQVIFYLTPVIWLPNLLPNAYILNFLELNPFYHLLELLRAPLLGQEIKSNSYLYILFLTFSGWGLTLIFYSKYLKRIAYWL
jgi:lipopolysaccharide transport system permease protein